MARPVSPTPCLSCCAAEVYALKNKGQDLTKRPKGDRYQSDFIWNTNWLEQVPLLVCSFVLLSA